MMHRYVAVISTRPGADSYADLAAVLGARLRGWTSAHSGALARVWVHSQPPSRLAHWPLKPGGCGIGIRFEADAPAKPDLIAMLKTQWGAYLAIQVDEAAHRVCVLRDPTGRIECWRLELAGADLLFSHLSDVAGLSSKGLTLNWDFIAYHLNLHYMQGEQTGLNEITELLPGELLQYDQGQPSRRLAWRPEVVAAEPFPTVEAARKALRQAAGRSTTAWAGGYGTIALDLSGGLDSSIVLGLLRTSGQDTRIWGVNYVTAHSEGDERAYARDVAARHGVQLIERDLQLQALTEAQDFTGRLLRPSSRMMPMGYDPLGREILQDLSADAFFTGSGGDHLFFDGIRGESAIDYLIMGGDWKGFVATAHQVANLSQDTLWNVAGAALKRRLWPDSAEWALHRNPMFLSAEAVASGSPERFAHPWLRTARSGTPPGKFRQILNIAELYRHYWRYGRADVAEEVHPLFSQPVMEACLRIPTYWFAAGGVQRGLARQAFGDLLPESVRTRRSKGANTSHWIHAMASNLPEIRTLLLEGELARRGLLHRERLEAALTPLGLTANRKLGSLVTCLTTEMWLQAMKPPVI